MGTSAFVQSKCVEIAETGEHLLSEIVNLKDRQCSMLILHHCHVPRLTYLARQIPPQDLAKAANIHDNMTRSSFANIIGLPHLDDIKWEQATSKIKFGGFSLTRISQVSHAAFLSCWCQSLKDLPNRFPSMAFLASYLESSALTSGSIGYTVWSSFQAVPSLPKSIGPDPESQTLEDFISYPKSLQYLPRLLLIMWISLSNMPLVKEMLPD